MDEEQANRLGQRLEAEWRAGRGAEYQRLLQLDGRAHQRLREDEDITLMYVDPTGFPVYYCVDNLNAARTLGTDEVWPGGPSGLNLSGAGFGHLGLWDSGEVLTGHQEFGGRVTQNDSGGSSSHATHVAGTLIASGVDPAARGMAFEANLQAWDWEDDLVEMMLAADGGLRISNHSYGWATGWYSYGGDWYWFGDTSISETEDHRFGFYSDATMELDQLAYFYPDYLIVRSAGNDRNDYGPGPGGEHYVWQDGDWVLSWTTRDPDGGASGYDCVGSKKTAKNTLTVGAVEDIPGGYTNPADVVMTSFSNWGPTDDGRIKPDLVANGVELYSTDDDYTTDYSTKSGTSMASPNIAGSVALLNHHYQDLLGEIPRAATMKGLVIHTADEAGTAEGPDYAFGWGLMNTRTAAELISLQVEENWHIRERQLQDQGEYEVLLDVDPGAEVRITMCWTDPAGAPPAASVDPPDPMLVHDLDLLLVDPSEGEHLPWVLDPAAPADPATRGDNTRDNVEQIGVTAPEAGIYTLRVTHKDSIDPQDYTLIVSGAVEVDCSAPTPLAPEVDIAPSGADVILSWPPVTGSVEGCPITVDEYQVWKTMDYLAPFALLDVVTGTEYLDADAAGEAMGYYRVVAVSADAAPGF